MQQEPLDFSRRIALDRIGTKPGVHEIAATPAERAALARRFALAGLDELSAVVTLVRAQAGRVVELTARFRAAAVQACVVTLDPVPATIEGEFAIIYGQLSESPGEEFFDPDPEGAAFEPLPDAAIDIGEAVAQQLSLELDPYPRSPDARLAADRPGGPVAANEAAAVPGPFAALTRLKPGAGPGRS